MSGVWNFYFWNAAVRCAMCFAICIAVFFFPTVCSQQTESDDGVGCKGGTCPFAGDALFNKVSINGARCDLWMAPSPIKQAEDHSFGLGIFTGKAIPKGTPIEANVYGHGELLIPIYSAFGIYENHPPLREFIWDEDNLPETAVEYPLDDTALFVPGLAAIAPCTSENYNLRLGYEKGWSASTDDGGVHRSTHPQAGAFSYRHNVTYIAVRDIAAGEELTVNCGDDSFDGGSYSLTQYDESSQNVDLVTCLDQNLRVGTATQKAPIFEEGNIRENIKVKDNPMGLGLFAKRNLVKGQNIISSPLTPVHRNVLKLVDDNPNEDLPINDKQLMLNYVFGHPDSDLLLLPIGPMVNFINHRRANDGGANAEIRWHHLNSDHVINEKTLEDLKAYHDTSLFELTGEVVAFTHGRGLVMDIVALRDIAEGEEVYLDYGPEWQSAWDAHTARFFAPEQRSQREADRGYHSAENYDRLLRKEFEEQFKKLNQDGADQSFHYNFLTEPEEDESNRPYPENVEFYCFYHLPERDNKDEETNPSILRKASASMRERNEPSRYSWHDHSDHECFRPCSLVDRYSSKPSGDYDEDKHRVDSDSSEPSYTVILYTGDDRRVTERCWITGTDKTDGRWLLEDVPQSEIRLLDSPYTTDVLKSSAFRHEIGVPEGFYPEKWMANNRKKRLRASLMRTESSAPSNYKLMKQQSSKENS